MSLEATRQLDRLDRHVGRSYLRIGEATSRSRAAYTLEEALRLTTLPGEEEGRIYCFRKIALGGVQDSASRKHWTDAVQQTLTSAAAQAVHGTDARAGWANEVYFHNREEAIETLLRAALHSHPGTVPDWFAASILGVEPRTTYVQQIPVLLAQLRRPDLPLRVAAEILFAALGSADPATLLGAIPVATVREWLGAFEEERSGSGGVPPVQAPGEIAGLLRRAALQFGWRSPHTLWLASMAVVRIAPGTISPGIAVKRARATLRWLEEDFAAQPDTEQPDIEKVAARDARNKPLIFSEDAGDAATMAASPSASNAAGSAPPVQDFREPPELIQSPAWGESAASPWNQSGTAQPSGPSESSLAELFSASGIDLPSTDRHPRSSDIGEEADLSPQPRRQMLLGEATQGGGLYFLLHVLRQLGIAAVLENSPALADTGFASHILKRLARHAGVAPDDPILACLQPEEAKFLLLEEVLEPLLPQAWPGGWAASRRADFGSGDLLRLWVLAVRRWCRRASGLTMAEIVNRKGRVWLTRTDLDVTFPLAGLDIRIRRIGLDIDPGWVPWFGDYGRVVRFHYRDRDPAGPA